MDGIALMGSAMSAARARLDVAASNLANASTDGFTRRVAHARLTANGLVASMEVDAREGPLRRTGRALDVASLGGGFAVRDADGRASFARSSSLTHDAAGRLVDERGRLVVGVDGPIRASGEATIDDRGGGRDGGRVVGRMRLSPGTEIRSGFVAAGNVDAIHEMVDVLEAQRSFETDAKTLAALDTVREKDADQLGKIAS